MLPLFYSNNYTKIKGYALSSSGSVRQFFIPYFDFLGTRGFIFQRIYKTIVEFFYQSSPIWIQNWFKKSYFSIQNFNCYSKIPKRTLWSRWLKQDKKVIKIIKDAYNNFDYKNIIIMPQPHNDYVNLLAIMGSTRDQDINNDGRSYDY